MKKILKKLNPLHFFRLPKKIWIPVLLVLLVAGWFILRSGKQTDIPQLADVKKQTLKSSVSASGVMTGQDTAALKFKSSGKLAYLGVKTGDTVNRGQTIASLDTQDLNIALQQAENNYRDKQAAVDKILDDLKDRNNDETYTQKQTRTTAQVARDNAYDSVKAAQRAFQDAILVAPISGTVTQSTPIPGQYVSAADTIAQVVNWQGGVYFDTDIDEADISKISLAQPAEVTLNAYADQIFPGVVDEILPQTKTTTSGATVVTVRIKLSNPPSQLIANLNGQASIIIKQVANVLAIPQEALTDDKKVVVQTKEGLVTREVTPGIMSDTDVEIVKGLNEGDKVVTNPAKFVNQPVRSTNPLNRIIRGTGLGGRRS